MINAILRLFRGDATQRPRCPETNNPQLPPMFPERSFDVLIARRAERVMNRDREKAAQYERLHIALKELVSRQ